MERTTLIQKAVSFYLDVMKRRKLYTLLAEGYAEMSEEALEITNEFDVLDADEAIKMSLGLS